MSKDSARVPDKNQKPPEETGNAKGEPPSEVRPVSVGKEQPLINLPHPPARTKERKRKRRFEIWTLIGILVAAGTGGAIVWQDVIANRTLRELQRQYPKLAESADAAYLAAEALRPRLAIVYLTPQPTTAKGPPVHGGKLHVWFQVPNYGPNPAENVQLCEFDGVVLPGRLEKLPYRNCRSSSSWGFGSIVPPITELANDEAPGWGMDGETAVTAAETRELKERIGLEAVFSVMAIYDDAGRGTHHAESCILFKFIPNWGTQSAGPVTWGSKPCPWKTKND